MNTSFVQIHRGSYFVCFFFVLFGTGRTAKTNAGHYLCIQCKYVRETRHTKHITIFQSEDPFRNTVVFEKEILHANHFKFSTFLSDSNVKPKISMHCLFKRPLKISQLIDIAAENPFPLRPKADNC